MIVFMIVDLTILKGSIVNFLCLSLTLSILQVALRINLNFIH
jgi:hypothetical protein